MLALGVTLLSPLLGVTARPADTPSTLPKLTLPSRNGLYPLDVVDKLLGDTMPQVQTWMAKTKKAGNCTLENAAIRREWSDLSVAERQDYLKAVLCLQKLPPKAPRDTAPGSLNRFDDFVATHMTQAMILHDPNHLFASHRYYLWLYEKALRDECGYKGYQPYMNYDRYAQDLIHSPMFNGNGSSMGGNGAPTAYTGVPQPFKAPYNMIKSGGGGGCVTEGPFKDMVVSLGPRSTFVNDIPKNPRSDGMGSNPRCLRRDVNKNSALGATANYTYQLITENKDIDAFYNRYMGQPQLKNDNHPWGLHNAGHYTIGGDPGGDFYCSPGDPAFYFHHGMLDRVWWIWQMQDPENRINLIPGQAATAMNHTGMNMKRQAKSGGDMVVELGWTGGPVALKDLNDNLGGIDGQMCYIYV